MESFDNDIILRLIGLLPFSHMPTACRVCRLWKDLSGKAFATILKWKKPCDKIRILDEDVVEDEQVDRVGRSGGAIEFCPHGQLVVQRAIPLKQGVATYVVDMSTSARVSFSSRPTRTWPYDLVTGGFGGGLVGHRVLRDEGRISTAFFPTVDRPDGGVSDLVVEVPSREYDNILVSGGQLFLLKKSHWWRDAALPADVFHVRTRRKVRVCLAHMRDRLRHVLDGADPPLQARPPPPRAGPEALRAEGTVPLRALLIPCRRRRPRPPPPITSSSTSAAPTARSPPPGSVSPMPPPPAATAPPTRRCPSPGGGSPTTRWPRVRSRRPDARHRLGGSDLQRSDRENERRATRSSCG